MKTQQMKDGQINCDIVDEHVETLRDRFAMACLAGFSTASMALNVALLKEGKENGVFTEQDWASLAYKMADAMLIERAKNG